MTEGLIEHELRWINQRKNTTNYLKDRHLTFEPTGKVLVACNCGFDTGWINRDSMDAGELEKLREEHTNPSATEHAARQIAEKLKNTPGPPVAGTKYATMLGEVFQYDGESWKFLDQ